MDGGMLHLDLPPFDHFAPVPFCELFGSRNSVNCAQHPHIAHYALKGLVLAHTHQCFMNELRF